MRAASLLVLAGLLAVPAAAAQAPGQGPRRGGAGPPRDEAFRMIDAYIVSNLQESLGLSDEQFVKLLPLVKHLQSDRRDLMQRRQQALRDLRQLRQAGGATEAKVAERLKELKGLETEEPDRLRKNRDAIDAALTPLQQAKFRIMELDIEQRIRELMRQIRGQRRPADRSEPDPQ